MLGLLLFKRPLFGALLCASFIGAFCGTPAAAASKKGQEPVGQSDALMQWMSLRYGPKTMLGLKWKDQEKAKSYYVREVAAERAAAAGGFALSGARANRSRPGTSVGGSRIGIIPSGSFSRVADSSSYSDTKFDSYTEIKFYRAAPVSFNMGYIACTELRDTDYYSYANPIYIDGVRTKETESDVIYSSLVLRLPAENFSFYGFGGPALVKYKYTERSRYNKEDWTAWPAIVYSSGVSRGISKSGSGISLLLGAGMSFDLSSTGIGVYAEYKKISDFDSFRGLQSLSLGVSFGF